MNFNKVFGIVLALLVLIATVNAATITASPTSGSAPLNVTFWADSPLWFGKYTWSFGDDTGAVGKKVDHTYYNQGSYQVDLVVFDYWGIGQPTQHARTFINVGAGQTGSVFINTTPSPATGSSPLNVFFEAVSTYTNVVYQWDFGDGSTGFGRTLSHTYTNSNNSTRTYTATLFVKRNNNVIDTETVTVTVNSGGTSTGSVTINTNPSNANVNIGQSINFSASTSNNGSCGNFTYNWNFGDGSSGNFSSVSHSYNNAGTYTATVNVFNNCGANNSFFGSQTRTVTVSGNQNPNLGTPTITLSFHPSNQSVPNNVVMSAHATSNQSVTYNWNFGDGSSGNFSSVSHNYNNAGTYTVTVTAHSGGQQTSASRTFTLTNNVQAPTINLSFNPSNMQAPNTVTMSAVGNYSNPFYTWNFGDGSSGSGQTTSHTYNNAGTYTLTVTVNTSGQNVTASRTFTLTQNCKSELQAVAMHIANDPTGTNPNNHVGDNEMLQAVEWWKNGTIVPGTCNKVISSSDLFTIANSWINNLFVS